MTKLRNGFYISLDFELFWGFSKEFKISDKEKLKFEKTRLVIPKLLALFKEFDISATWAIVGILLNESKKEAIKNIINPLPDYHILNANNYDKLDFIGENEENAPWYYAHSLCQIINNTPNQEIASHTYSHFYCLEEGQSEKMFRSDIELAKKLTFDKLGIIPESIVFPRNQVNYNHVLLDKGFRTYRGNELHWAYRNGKTKEFNNVLKRIFRFLDRYIPLTNNVFDINSININNFNLVNVQQSRLLIGYNNSLRWIKNWRIKRIKSSMTYAAKNKLSYHLWWHPHNFSSFSDENLKILKEILKHYQVLNQKYEFNSYKMIDALNNESTLKSLK